MQQKWVLGLGLLFGLVLAPAFAFAQWNGDWDSRKYRDQLSSLGDTAVQTLPVPVLVGVEVADIKPDFGEARGGGTRTHEGQDIIAPNGTPVASPTDAVVVGTGTGPSSGIYIRTANPGGEIFVYMHLSAIAEGVEPGKKVSRGEIIGFVGNTGNASGGGAHLHFEIRKNGTAIDPFPRLTAVFNAEERVAALTSMGGQSVPTVASATTDAVHAVEAASKVVVSFKRDLELGMEGSDVKDLQIFLNEQGFVVASSGVGSKGSETDYFGAKTQAAVVRYQKAHGISPSAGYFGPKTRAHVLKVASL